MPQVSYLFSAGRVMALEKRLLTRDDIRALIEGDPIRVLNDRGYGGSSQGSTDAEALIKGEIESTRALAGELAGDSELMQLFFTRSDVQNIKRFVKLKLMGSEISAVNAEYGGLYEPALLALMVKEWDFPTLPETFKSELDTLDELLADNKNPQLISVCLDRAYYKNARLCKDEFAQIYFGMECDFINLETLLRMREYKPERVYFEKLLMPEYKISTNRLAEYLNAQIDIRSLTAGMPQSVKGKVIPALENHDAPALQRIRTNTLLSLAHDREGDMQSVYPVIWYYLARLREAEIIRMCVTMRRGGFSAQDITERLCELYG